MIDLGGSPRVHVLRHRDAPGSYFRLDGASAALVARLDGSRDIEELVQDARGLIGNGPALLVRLLAELGDRGLLQDVARAQRSEPDIALALSWLGRSGAWEWRRAPEIIAGLHRRGGRLLATPAAVVLYGLIVLGGLFALGEVLAGGRCTPLVVSGQLGLGVACFLAARVVMAVVHELAHALALAACGQRIAGAGVRLVAIFPYLYVDTSPAWLVSRGRRLAVSAAGPIADLTLAGGAAIAAAALGGGTAREVCFQVALAGYIAALSNLSPLRARDGRRMLDDLLSGAGALPAAGGRRLRLPAVALWCLAVAALALGVLGTGLSGLRAALPGGLSLTLFATLWALLVIPTGLLAGAPLARRRRRPAGPASSPGVVSELSGRALGGRAPGGRAPSARPGAPLPAMAARVLGDASLRRRVRALGAPPGFAPLGARVLTSTVAGVVLAAGGASLALTRAAATLLPPIERLAQRSLSDTNIAQLGELVGLQAYSDAPAPRFLASSAAGTPQPASAPAQPLYEPPAAAAPSAAGNGATGAGPGATGAGLALPPWPGNDAGQVAIAHWMAAGAESAGLPGPLPVMAALAESDLNNNACCNLDSRGYFQMRQSIFDVPPWTGYYRHPELQLEWFIQRALAVRAQMVADGDQAFGVDPVDWGTWDADVEVPAAMYRYRYELQLANAVALLSQPSPQSILDAGASPPASAPAAPAAASAPAAVAANPTGELIDTPAGASFRSFLMSLLAPGASLAAQAGSPPAEGYVAPFRAGQATIGRTDQGVDVDLRAGDAIRTIGASRVIGIMPDWYDGEPYVWLELLSGPLTGQYYYVAEEITPSVHTGQVLAGGRRIGTYAAYGTGIEIGWSTADGITLARAMADGTASAATTLAAIEAAASQPAGGIPGAAAPAGAAHADSATGTASPSGTPAAAGYGAPAAAGYGAPAAAGYGAPAAAAQAGAGASGSVSVPGSGIARQEPGFAAAAPASGDVSVGEPGFLAR